MAFYQATSKIKDTINTITNFIGKIHTSNQVIWNKETKSREYLYDFKKVDSYTDYDKAEKGVFYVSAGNTHIDIKLDKDYEISVELRWCCSGMEYRLDSYTIKIRDTDPDSSLTDVDCPYPSYFYESYCDDILLALKDDLKAALNMKKDDWKRKEMSLYVKNKEI